jgi:hypothetical protein
MAIEVGKELSWQDDSLCRLEHKTAADTFSTILVPGYKFNLFFRSTVTAIGNKMKIQYPGIRITKEV